MITKANFFIVVGVLSIIVSILLGIRDGFVVGLACFFALIAVLMLILDNVEVSKVAGAISGALVFVSSFYVASNDVVSSNQFSSVMFQSLTDSTCATKISDAEQMEIIVQWQLQSNSAIGWFAAGNIASSIRLDEVSDAVINIWAVAQKKPTNMCLTSMTKAVQKCPELIDQFPSKSADILRKLVR